MSKPDNLEEPKQEIIQYTGTDVSTNTICRTLKRSGFSRKRLRHVALQRSEEKRKTFIEEMEHLNTVMLVRLDKCDSDKRNETRKYGYSLRGMTPVSFAVINDWTICYSCCDC